MVAEFTGSMPFVVLHLAWFGAWAVWKPMERHEEIDRLKTRLQWESGGPLAHLAGEATDAFAARAKALGGWIRENAEERPLVSLLCAFQLGFAAGRWGPRRAKH